MNSRQTRSLVRCFEGALNFKILERVTYKLCELISLLDEWIH